MQRPPKEPQRENQPIQVPNHQCTMRSEQGGSCHQGARTRQCSTYPMMLPALGTLKPIKTTSWQAYRPHTSTRGISTQDQACDNGYIPLVTLHCVIWDCVQESTTSEGNVHLLITLIEDGLPQSRDELPPPLRSYYQYREHVHSTDAKMFCPPSTLPAKAQLQ